MSGANDERKPDLSDRFLNNVKKLIFQLVDLWDDFDTYDVDSKCVNIIYSLRGIKVQINVEHFQVDYSYKESQCSC